MKSLSCVLALLTDTVLPPSPFLGDAEILSRQFIRGSDNSIQLLIRNDFQKGPIYPGATFHRAYYLHAAIRRLTQNPLDATSLNRVAVLFGSHYEPFPACFGVMFDRGFADPSSGDLTDDPNIVGPPREGCAIFLGAIQTAREDPLQYDRQVLFSTVHEVGHVFNLQHIEEPKNFLSTSDPNVTYPLEAFRFRPSHIELLRRAPSTPALWPGGSAFGDLGPLASHDFSRGVSTPASDGLQLELEMSQRSFFYFEPVELDIVLRARREAAQTFKVPACLDPGYRSFRIWIEDPSGERHLYRPHRLYCPHAEYTKLAPGERFRRDISIFGQSGGFTFSRTGIHKVWAEFRISQRRLIRSSAVEIEVRSMRKPDSKFEQVNKLFESKRGRLLTYHRIDSARGRSIQLFEDYLGASHKLESRGSVKYALGRAYLERSARLKRLPISEKYIRRARRLLKSARDDKYLGTHQREIAEKLLSESKPY
jgi:hypothetical protein